MIGNLALERIANEVVAFSKGEECLEPCCLCVLRRVCPTLALPCRHTFHPDCQINAHDLHPRYLRVEYMTNDTEAPVLIKTVERRMHTNSYSEIMAEIAPYASMASQHDGIKRIFEDAIARLKGTEVQVNEGMPTTIAVSGRFRCHPARSVVLGGRPKSKRTYQCSKCRGFGHNRRHCKLAVVYFLYSSTFI